MLEFQCKSYVTLGDAENCIFIVVGSKRGSQNPNGSLGFYHKLNLSRDHWREK